MLSMSPLKDSVNSSAGIDPSGGTWARLLDVAGRTVSPLCEIPWMCTAALANPKESAEGLEFRMTRSIPSCASWEWGFHFYHTHSSRINPLNLGRLPGNIFSARRERDATATSYASDTARSICLAFCCASSQRVINSCTRGYLTHQDNILCWSPMASIASPPVLVAPRWSRISLRVTCLKRVVLFLRQTTHISSTRERTNSFLTRSAVRMTAWRSSLRHQFFSWRRRKAVLLSSQIEGS